MKKFTKILSVIASVSLLNFNGIVFNDISNAMCNTKSSEVSSQFSLKPDYTYDELVKLLDSLEVFIEKSTSGKRVTDLDKLTLEVEKEYLKSQGIKEKYLKKLNRSTLREFSTTIDMTDPLYLKYFEHVNAGKLCCCRGYAGFVHELLKKFGVESYLIATDNSAGKACHTAVLVKMPLVKDQVPWYVVPCDIVSGNFKKAQDISSYLCWIIKRQQNIGMLQILHKYKLESSEKRLIRFKPPLTLHNIWGFFGFILNFLNDTTNEIRKITQN